MRDGLVGPGISGASGVLMEPGSNARDQQTGRRQRMKEHRRRSISPMARCFAWALSITLIAGLAGCGATSGPEDVPPSAAVAASAAAPTSQVEFSVQELVQVLAGSMGDVEVTVERNGFVGEIPLIIMAFEPASAGSKVGTEQKGGLERQIPNLEGSAVIPPGENSVSVPLSVPGDAQAGEYTLAIVAQELGVAVHSQLEVHPIYEYQQGEFSTPPPLQVDPCSLPNWLCRPWPPQDLQFVRTADGAIQVSWRGASLALSYRIERQRQGHEWQIISEVPRAAEDELEFTYLDASVEPGVHYYYRIVAVNTWGESGSGVHCAWPPTTIPTDLELSFGDEDLWIAYSTETPDYTLTEIYQQYRDPGEEDFTSWELILESDTVWAGRRGYIGRDWVRNREYHHRVVTYAGECGRAESEIHAAAFQDGLTAEPPTDLTLYDAGPDGTSHKARWRDNALTEESYSVWWVILEKTHGEANLPAHTGTGWMEYKPTWVPVTGDCYYYRVIANNSTYGSGFAEEQKCEPPGYAPAAPSNLRIEAETESSLTLKWDDNSANESGFRIYRKRGGGEVTMHEGRDAEQLIDRGLADGTEYCYTVEAYNDFGAAKSGEKCGRTKPIEWVDIYYAYSWMEPNFWPEAEEEFHAWFYWCVDGTTSVDSFKVRFLLDGSKYADLSASKTDPPYCDAAIAHFWDGVSAGPHKIEAIFDFEGKIVEIDEANNYGYISFSAAEP